MVLISACKGESSSNSSFYCLQLSIDCSNKFNKITFYTTKGEFDVELYYETNPLTVSNFLKNIDQNKYINKSFYKIIDYPNNRLIYAGINPNKYSSDLNNQNSQDTILIPLEIAIKGDNAPVYSQPVNDPITLSSLRHKFEPGTIAMVKFNESLASSTEFFFTLNDTPELDGRYSIFGKVVNGLEILKQLEKNDKILDMKAF